tara:strand:+ start:351 stop:1109 length:759 start_codon:yes stop_codon:yes gene_type:complete
MLMFSSYAGTVGLKSNNDIGRVVTKYDYLLTSHPQAHEAEFRKATMESFNADLASISKTLTKEELQVEIEKLIAKVPTQADRDAFNKILATSSKEELAAMFSNPNLLTQALRGEGANFSFTNGPSIHTIILGLVAVLVIAVIVDAIVTSIKYDFYYSYSIQGEGWVNYNTFDQQPTTTCYFFPSTSESEKQNMIDDALTRCEASSKYPETCRFSGWSYSDNFNQYLYSDPIFYYSHPISCWIQASVKTDDRP